MKAYELEAVLDGFKGKNIRQFGKSKGRVIRWELKEKTLKLITDQADVVILIEDIDQDLQQIEVMPEEVAVMAVPQTSMIQRVNKDLQEILMDNIKKLKSDKEYIPQAQEINANVRSMIDLAKAEIEYMKTLAYLHKK